MVASIILEKVVIEVMHRNANHIAFLLIDDVKIGDPIIASGVLLLDGARPKDGDPVICGTCGQHLGMYDCLPGNNEEEVTKIMRRSETISRRFEAMRMRWPE